MIRKPMKIGMIVYPKVEELDFVGPFETLSHMEDQKIDLISITLTPIKAYNGLRVVPDSTFSDDTKYDILLVPGGEGRKKAMKDPTLLSFIKDQAEHLKYLSSVCTGAFILAEAGLLDGLKATTHHSALEELEHYRKIEVVEERVVKNDTSPKIWTASGISSGIDLSLELISELCGKKKAIEAADRMEYPYWRFND